MDEPGRICTKVPQSSRADELSRTYGTQSERKQVLQDDT